MNVINVFIKSNFDVLIFSKDDRTRMPQKILKFIDENYLLDRKYNFIDLYIKK
jgi:hypothetical protein